MKGRYFGIVISTLNASEHLQGCLDSIFTQTDPDWQIVVIDGGSCDGTVDILRRNADRLSFWVSEPDKGIYDAWNKAIPHLTSPWVIFLGADDFLADNTTLQDIRPMLRDAEGQYGIVYGRVRALDGSGHGEILGRDWKEISRRFRLQMCIPHQGVFHSRELLRSRGGFNTDFLVAGDYELLLGDVLRRPPLYCDRVISVWRLGGVSSRPETSYRVFREFRKAQELHGIHRRVPSASEIRAVIKRVVFSVLGRGAGQTIVAGYRAVQASLESRR